MIVDACARFHRVTAPVRRAMRHHWNVGHHMARWLFYTPIVIGGGAAAATPGVSWLLLPPRVMETTDNGFVLVPEPSSLALVAVGVAVVWWIRRRRAA